MQRLFPEFTWRVSTASKTLFLTFDDGPIPEVTEFVLDQLREFSAKATFFCVGDNVDKHPALAERVVREGHRLGNHTHNHLSGWQTPPDQYLENIARCTRSLEALRGKEKAKMLFRPPYGKISRMQAQKLKEKAEVVMWDVLTYDFDATLAPEKCLRRSLAASHNGSIIVFHDNVKAVRLLEFVLPRYLAHFAGAGYNFAAL